MILQERVKQLLWMELLSQPTVWMKEVMKEEVIWRKMAPFIDHCVTFGCIARRIVLDTRVRALSHWSTFCAHIEAEIPTLTEIVVDFCSVKQTQILSGLCQDQIP
jgi:hypothetical protein